MKTYQYQLLILLLVLTYFCSCNLKGKKNNAGDSTDNGVKIEFENSLITFDASLYAELLKKINYQPMELTDITSMQINSFIPEAGQSVTCYLLDGFFLWRDVYCHLIGARGSQDEAVWLAVYNDKSEYIDSRIIYYTKSTAAGELEIYSKLDLAHSKISLFDNDNGMGDFMEIPLTIRPDGMFDEFPDTEFSEQTMAISNCNGNGLSGKFPLKQKWTLINFDQQTVTTVSTKKIYLDYIENLSTLYLPKNEESFHFDIAFKGIYSKSNLQLLPVKTEVLEDNEEIADALKENLPDDEYLRENTFEISKLQSFIHQDKKFWLVHYTQRSEHSEYTCLLGINPYYQVSILAYHCMYESYLFKLKNDVMLFTQNTSCGEGAFGVSYLYKIDTGFEKIFQDDITCD